MKTIRSSILCLGALLFTASLLHGQDLSKYRGFSIGASLSNVLRLSERSLADVRTIHTEPMLIQELTWWPASIPGRSSQPDNVEQILLSFSNGELYKISVTYDRTSTEGLTAPDMVKSISVKYGPATGVQSEIDPAMDALYDTKEGPLASWQNSQYAFDLVRPSFSDVFGVVIYSKQVNAEVQVATAEAVKLEEQQRPEKEADAKKKEAGDLEATREKNQKSFRP
ncbi:MAG: hypothetical protein WBR26_18105 [Candidatus Acidiferrum sp.]